MAAKNSLYKNELPHDRFLFGASTAPYARSLDWPMKEWEQDIKNMKELNFNTARIFVAWDRIESVAGKYDFTKPDHFMELAQKHDLGVILQFGGLFGNPCGIYQPFWLPKVEGVHFRETAKGEKDNSRKSVCPDDPIMRQKSFAFMEATVKRYAPFSNLLCWMVWNEPDRRSPCYCPCTIQLFQEWLKQEYNGDLERLNYLWGTEGPVNFTSWQDIPASGIPSAARHRDWRRFNQYRLYQAIKDITDLALENDPQRRPTTANIVHHHTGQEAGTTGLTLGLDVGKIAHALTIMGGSCYTIAHPYDTRPAYETAYKLSRLRTASQDQDRRVMVLETEAGPFKRMITDAQRRQRFYQLLAHNVKAILLWNYRSRISDDQAGLFHMLNWDGSINRRGRAIGEFSAVLQQHASLLNRVFPERAAAVLTTEESQVLAEAIHGGDYTEIHESRYGAYKLLWDMNMPTDCLTECQLDEFDHYKVILLPMVENMTPQLAERLTAYVEQGGTLIAESPFAWKDGDNLLQYRAPAFGLEKVFGGYTRDREGWETASSIILPSGKSRAFFFWHEFTLSGGEALGKYANGNPAVIANNYGKGRAVLAGTEVFRQYAESPQQATTDLLQREVKASGVKPTARIKGADEGIEVAKLSGPGGLLYIVINHNAETVEISLELEDPGPWKNMETSETLDLSTPLRLPPESACGLIDMSQ